MHVADPFVVVVIRSGGGGQEFGADSEGNHFQVIRSAVKPKDGREDSLSRLEENVKGRLSLAAPEKEPT